jgi:hypothetical protein
MNKNTFSLRTLSPNLLGPTLMIKLVPNIGTQPFSMRLTAEIY